MVGMISFEDIPGWPSPPAGLFEACEAALEASGFSPMVSRTPAGLHVADVATVSAVLSGYVASPKYMVVLRARALAALEDVFAGNIAAGRVYLGVTYQIDPASQANIAAKATAAIGVLNSTPGADPWPDGFYWIAADNSHTPMTAAQCYAFAQDVAGYVTGLIIVNRAIKDAIAAASTPDALAAIDVAAGWPSNS